MPIFLKRQRKLRNFIVDRRFQVPFIIFVLAQVTILALVQALMINENNGFFGFSPQALGFFSWVIALPINLLTSIVFSHRIAGPIYRLKKQMELSSSKGQLSKVTFRKGDFFPDLAGSYNVMVYSLNKPSLQRTAEDK